MLVSLCYWLLNEQVDGINWRSEINGIQRGRGAQLITHNNSFFIIAEENKDKAGAQHFNISSLLLFDGAQRANKRRFDESCLPRSGAAWCSVPLLSFNQPFQQLISSIPSIIDFIRHFTIH